MARLLDLRTGSVSIDFLNVRNVKMLIRKQRFNYLSDNKNRKSTAYNEPISRGDAVQRYQFYPADAGISSIRKLV
jgi:hypothetical protein